jgi:hypothetical protein
MEDFPTVDLDAFSEDRREVLVLEGLLYEMQGLPQLTPEVMAQWSAMLARLHRYRQAEAMRKAMR